MVWICGMRIRSPGKETMTGETATSYLRVSDRKLHPGGGQHRCCRWTMKNPKVQIITECGPCMGNDWRYPKEYHLNQPSKPHTWKGTRPWSQRYRNQIQTNADTNLEQKNTFFAKLINFVTNIFFIEEEVWEEEDSQEEEERGLTTSKDNPHSKF